MNIVQDKSKEAPRRKSASKDRGKKKGIITDTRGNQIIKEEAYYKQRSKPSSRIR